MTKKLQHLENDNFRQLSDDSLRYIISDCRAAMDANPDNPKCVSGRGNYADQINDAATIITFRKQLSESENPLLLVLETLFKEVSE